MSPQRHTMRTAQQKKQVTSVEIPIKTDLKANFRLIFDGKNDLFGCCSGGRLSSGERWADA